MTDILKQLNEFSVRYPGDRVASEPIHVLYGGAHLFRRDSLAKMASIAARAFDDYLAQPSDVSGLFEIDAKLADDIHERVRQKLATRPIEDLRIDFEDGYGIRSESEEDEHAASAAAELAAAMADGKLPDLIGIRVKAFTPESMSRAKRTLRVFFDELARAGAAPQPGFAVTLPKPVIPEQVSEMARELASIENDLGFDPGSLAIEIMIETPQALIGSDGRIALRSLVDAADGRCVAAHFGIYDHTAALGITAQYQTYDHPAADLARGLMQLALAGTGVRISDGATTEMPIGPHRDADLSSEQLEENRRTVHRAWRLHYDNVRRSLANGIYQGWDLHPAQLVARYAAVYSFFWENAHATGERLSKFVENSARATLVGNVFDDAATGHGLLNFFNRAINCGAMTGSEAESLTGISKDELISASFSQILANR